MIIKNADDKTTQISTLRELMAHPHADAGTRQRIEREVRNIQAGIRGEDEATYEMKVHYGQSKNWMVLHDLRIEHGGVVAQIDHLVINRALEMWVCESKHFSEGIAINENGEFSAFFGSRPYGVPSPIEQNNRHLLILQRLFDSGAVELPTRLGMTIKPHLNSFVLVSKGARISRPKTKVAGIEAVIKNDQLSGLIEKSMSEANPLIFAKLVGADTLEAVARSIAKLHKPIEVDWKAKFGLSDAQLAERAVRAPAPARAQPAKQVIQESPVPVAAASQSFRPTVIGAPATQHPVAAPTQPLAASTQATKSEDGEAPKKKLVCHSCATSVPYNVAKFCWFNKPKFGGNVFCIDCQKTALKT